ncbi:MAG: hypothetical protein AAFZ63_22225 [Bacteroidota bacterium]
MLQTIQRPPTPTERSILEVQQLYAQHKLKEGFHWKNGLLTSGFFIATLVAFYWVGGHWVSLLSKLEVSETLQWPEHLAVVEMSIEEVLEKCKQQLRTKIEGR